MSMKWSRASVIVTSCTLIGFVWRAEGLLRRDFWLDEVATIIRFRLPTIDSLLIDLESSPFPPLYYLLLWGWLRIWGISELAVRTLPMLFGVVTLPITYVVWAGLVGRRNALWAVVLLSTNAFHVFYSQDAKMYAVVWFLATLSSGAFLRVLQGGPRQNAWTATYGLSNAALMQISYVGVVPLAIQLLYGFLILHRVRPFAGRLTITAALSCLPSVAWLPTTIRTVTNRTGISWIAPVSGRSMFSELSQAFGYYILGYRTVPNPSNDLYGLFFSQIYGPIGWLVGAAILAYLIQLGLGQSNVQTEKTPAPGVSDVVLYLTLWASLPAMSAFLFSITIYPLWGPPRYLMASGPAIILLVGCALGSLRWQVPACLLGAALISANAAMILFEKTHVTTDPYRQMVGISAEVARRSPEFRGEPSQALDPASMIHLENGSLSDYNALCVKYEIGKINVESREALLRPDSLKHAVERGLAFFVIELRPIESQAAARKRLEERIASARAGELRKAARYKARLIFSAEVRAEWPLPSPLMSHVAQLWACLPDLPVPQRMDADRDSPGKARPETGD